MTGRVGLHAGRRRAVRWLLAAFRLSGLVALGLVHHAGGPIGPLLVEGFLLVWVILLGAAVDRSNLGLHDLKLRVEALQRAIARPPDYVEERDGHQEYRCLRSVPLEPTPPPNLETRDGSGIARQVPADERRTLTLPCGCVQAHGGSGPTHVLVHCPTCAMARRHLFRWAVGGSLLALSVAGLFAWGLA